MESDKDRILYGFWLSPYMSLVAQLLMESDLSFRYERVSPFVGGTHSPAHKARNPFGKIPCLEEPNGLLVNESQAICRYLSRVYPAAQKFYPCHDPVACAEIDGINDFLTFSISGPFFNWFVVGAYYPQAFGLKTESESEVFSAWSLMMVKNALARLIGGSSLNPFLLGDSPVLPDFHLFHVLVLGKTFSKIFDMPFLDLTAGEEQLQQFYDAMLSSPSTEKILLAQSEEYDLTRCEIFEEFANAYAEMLAPARVALEAMFGHPV